LPSFKEDNRDFPAFSWLGFSAQDWLEDICLRINKINISNEKKKLQALEERLHKLISPEQLKAIELQKIEKELS
jgi:hypothetical protein